MNEYIAELNEAVKERYSRCENKHKCNFYKLKNTVMRN